MYTRIRMRMKKLVSSVEEGEGMGTGTLSKEAVVGCLALIQTMRI